MTSETQKPFDYARWEAQLDTLQRQFREADPFPHIVIENFIDGDYARSVIPEYAPPQSPTWTDYKHFNERKQAQTKRELIPDKAGRLIDEFNSPRFLSFVSRLTGIPDLLPDPRLEGGGLHQVEPGGFLNIHADFTSHPHNKNWTRRINLLLYFNENWKEEFGGHLELWDKSCKRCVKKVLPVLNRAVLFETATDSYHGHPEPLRCPPGTTRKSMALYYFTAGEKAYSRSTEYKARPEDSVVKSAVIRLDKWALRLFDILKRRFGLSNDVAAKLLKRFFK